MLRALQDAQQSHHIPLIIINYFVYIIGGDADILIATTAA